MTPRRICYIGWADHVHVERWAGYFAARGHEVSVISYSSLGRYPAGVRQVLLRMNGRGDRAVRWRLRYLLWRLRPEIVHVHWAHFAAAVRAAWPGPLAVTAWGSDVYRRDQFDDAQWQRLGDALRAAELVTCDSNDLERTMAAQFAVEPARLRVIQWGVDTTLFTPEGADLRDALGLRGRCVVFSARNFTPLYNQETVVRAFAALREHRPDAFLLMKSYGGDAAYMAKINDQIRGLGIGEHVRILDTMPYEEMPALYRSADVTVSVPLSDAAPMSLLEAMASGSPSVVCDLPSLREWVSHGETGYLAPAQDAGAVAAALQRALEPGPQREQLRHAARRLVEVRASQHVHMAAAAACYDALCESRAVPALALG